ncbi:MAG: putative aminophospholipid-translocase [Alyxoria varia]|nr:MAG: putative aminophospholipid-translocase [Alyxoria varia]
MSSLKRSPHAQEPYDDESSDEVLSLDDLDPSHQGQEPDTINGRVPLRRLRIGRHHKTKRDGSGYKDTPEDTQRLLNNEESTTSGGSINTGGDDAPLLPNSEADLAPREASGNINRSGLSRLLQKLRSRRQDVEEEEYDPSTNRLVSLNNPDRFPPNLVSNAKYTPWSFLPRTLYNEFSFFFNLYFLLVALSQLIPQLRIGYLSTYVAPLAFVLMITLGKEAYDDITRRRRDAELNSEKFTVLGVSPGASEKPIPSRPSRLNKRKRRRNSEARLDGVEDEEEELNGGKKDSQVEEVREITKFSKDLKVGDILKLGKDQRVPADAIILKSCSPESSSGVNQGDGEAFIRTDQLDGETDWKLRVAPPLSQLLKLSDFSRLEITAAKPEKKVNEFIGSLSLAVGEDDRGKNRKGEAEDGSKSTPLNIDNTAWANTVLASQVNVYAAIVYTGPQTRQALSTSPSRTKAGLLEYEINNLTKILCALTLLLSFLLVAFEKFQSPDGREWYIAVMRYLILFSTIIPINLRVNLDLGKSVYAWFIHRDKDIPGTLVRTSTIPEDLGRIEYLLSDKTGTLTQNDMVMRKVHVGTVSYANDAMTEVAAYVRQVYGAVSTNSENSSKTLGPQGTIPSSTQTTRSRREIGSRVRDVVLALAVCHNVTPTVAEEDGKEVTSYQASSPDEIAIVRWTESVGLRLAHRDRHSMVLESTHSGEVVARVEILQLFPFTSDGKRMGIIVKFTSGVNSAGNAESQNEPIWFFQKGADTVMSSIVATNDWLDEETANMAREGLRTLVIGRKKLSRAQYESFVNDYKKALLELHGRDVGMARVVKDYLEQDLELLGVTGVEDKLQQDVKPSLELLRNAGIKIWMLTGDKVETARCVAVSSKLVARGQYVHVIQKMSRKDDALSSLDFLRSQPTAALLIDGPSLSLLLAHHSQSFISTAVLLPAVIACRCSPMQKAQLATLIRQHTRKRVCAIGDGGNDVSMIQAADVGLGIVGKEGRQASLAADFSITQFRAVTKLLVWHGRNSYKRSAKLAQFVMHRGLVISVCQTVYSVASKFEPVALYKDWLLVGYATVYTMAPVFSLVLDTDIPPRLAHLYPELYAELATRRSLSYRTFFVWVGVSLWQGIAIQILSQMLTSKYLKGGPDALISANVDEQSFPRMVALSFTSLIINELVMVAVEVTTWHWIMIASILGTAAIYVGSVPFLGVQKVDDASTRLTLGVRDLATRAEKTGYFDLGFMASPDFAWRVAVVAASAIVPVVVVKGVGRWARPSSYRRVMWGMGGRGVRGLGRRDSSGV